ncbi:MAG: hypothetical protein IJ960_02595 [Oscillospiraceae bacterium]|nr:hypothetical protein [Oscillospiraceae bacterium]
MKEQIHTVPVNEAFESGDECPFCQLRRKAEQSAIRYALGPGASYMEPDVRGETDRQGFCGEHMKKMYDYGNSLGSALMMQTWLNIFLEELDKQMDHYELPAKRSLFRKKSDAPDSLADWLSRRTGTCYLCAKIDYNMERYIATFFTLVKEQEFRDKVASSKGFCLGHFEALLKAAPEQLPNAQREWFYDTVFRLMRENLARVKGDLDWFIEKFDYRNASADWRNSRDAVSRTMQKLQSIYPADPPYKNQ